LLLSEVLKVLCNVGWYIGREALLNEEMYFGVVSSQFSIKSILEVSGVATVPKGVIFDIDEKGLSRNVTWNFCFFCILIGLRRVGCVWSKVAFFGIVDF